MYWTVTESPALAAGPVPTIRSFDSSWVGGAPGGTVIVGSVPIVPAADGWAIVPIGTLDAGVVGALEFRLTAEEIAQIDAARRG